MRCALAATATLAALNPIALGAEPNTLSANTADGAILVRRGDTALVELQTTPRPTKLYVRALATPAGASVLLDAPADHPHHHGLMLAMGVNDCEFWHEDVGHQDSRAPRRAATIGRQSPRAGATLVREQDGRVVIQQTIDWLDGEGEPLIVERRTTTVAVADKPAPATIVTWSSRLTAGIRDVECWGPYYFGLGARLTPAFAVEGAFIDAGDEPPRPGLGSERLRGGPWCAGYALVAGRPVTVAMFDRPRNPRPVQWFTMTSPFAYVSAAPPMSAEPLRIEAGGAIELAYCLVAADGRLSADELAALRDRWLGDAAAGGQEPQAE